MHKLHLPNWRYFSAFLFAAFTGCEGKGELPKTYPVSGKVGYDQGQVFSTGTIRFEPLQDSRLTVAGKIQQDGTFTLAHWQRTLPGSGSRRRLVPSDNHARGPVRSSGRRIHNAADDFLCGGPGELFPHPTHPLARACQSGAATVRER